MGLNPLAEAFPSPNTIYQKLKLEFLVNVMVPIHLIRQESGIHEIR